MTPALIPLWILIAPLVLVVVDWLVAPKATSMVPRQPGATYPRSPSIVTR